MEILLVEDDELLCEEIAEFLSVQFGHCVTQCHNGLKALELFKQSFFPLVITDLRMPGLDGVELSKNLKTLPQGARSDIVILTAYGDLTSALQSIHAGVFDYILKPISVKELAKVINKVALHQSFPKGNKEEYPSQESLPDTTIEIADHNRTNPDVFFDLPVTVGGVGKIGVFSKQMRTIVTLAKQFGEDPSMPVLIEGETGTGKEIIAQLIHYSCPTENTPFISINCCAIPSNLFESELFGYEGGSFTGAKKTGMMGKFELAQKGTIYLDEIGETPLELQPKLLRLIEEHALYRIGGVTKIPIDCRIICSSNRNIESLIEKGQFRQDLFYRLNRGRIYLPPLRKRTEAIVPLAQMFLEEYAKQKKRRFRFIQKDSATILENYSWPGNIRELKNTIELVVLLYDDIAIRPDHLKFLNLEKADMMDFQSSQFYLDSITLPPEGINLEDIEAQIIRKVLSKFNNNKSRTAAYLGISRKTLRRRIDGLK